MDQLGTHEVRKETAGAIHTAALLLYLYYFACTAAASVLHFFFIGIKISEKYHRA